VKKTVKLKSMAIGGGKALLLRHAVGFVINFVGGVILARLLGPEILGAYFISFTVFMFGRALVDFGVLTHFIRRQSEPGREEIKTAFSLQQILGFSYLLFCVLFAAPAAAGWYKVPGIEMLVISAGLAAYFYSWQSIPLALLERKLKYSKVGVIEVSEILIFNLAAVALSCFYNDGVLAFSLANVLRGFFPGVLAAAIGGFKPGLEFRFDKLKEKIRLVFPLFSANIAVYLVMLAPPVIMGNMAGVKEYGLAWMGYIFLQYTMVIATVFQRIGLTTFSRLQSNMKEFDRFVNSAIKLLAVIYVPLLMGLASISPFILPLLYGEKWGGMEKVVIIAAIPLYLSSLLGLLTSALLSKGKYKLVMVQSLLYTVIYWAAMYIFVKQLAAVTMPIAHLCGIVGAGWLLVYGYNKYCGKINYGPNIFLLLSGLCAMGIAYFFSVTGRVLFSLVVWLVFVIIVFLKYKDLLPFFKKIQEANK
jgi:PST family polysaccharide transporter